MTTIKGIEIKTNMTLSIEYGCEGNFVTLVVKEIKPSKWYSNSIIVYGTSTSGMEVDFCVDLDEEVKLVEAEEANEEASSEAVSLVEEANEAKTMSERMLLNRVKKLKALEEQQKELVKQIDELKDGIKADMEQKGVEEQVAGDNIVRFTTVTSNRFSTKDFKEEHSRLYNQYMKQTATKRFSIA